MFNFITKIIAFPLCLLISNLIFTDIYYAFFYQPLFVGIILATILHFIDLASLKPGYLIINTIGEFLIIFLIVYFTQFLLPTASINLIGSLIAATILTVAEFLINRFLLTDNKLKE